MIKNSIQKFGMPIAKCVSKIKKEKPMYASAFCIENSHKIQKLKSSQSSIMEKLTKKLNLVNYTAILTSIFLGIFTTAGNNHSTKTIRI